MRFFYWFFVLALLNVSVNVSAGTLHDQLLKGRSGDFMVLQSGKISFFVFINKYAKNVLLEEITIPSAKLAKIADFKQWIANGADDAIGWNAYDIPNDVTKPLRIIHKMKPRNAKLTKFLSHILKAPMIPVPDDKRKKIGVKTAGYDRRAIWHPSMEVDGVCKTIPSTMYRLQWPKNSTVKGECIELFIAKKHRTILPVYTRFVTNTRTIVFKGKTFGNYASLSSSSSSKSSSSKSSSSKSSSVS